jgi:hypothetical protein
MADCAGDGVNYALAGVTVRVVTGQPEVIDYLEEFYPRAPGQPSWTLEAEISPGTAAMRRTSFGVGIRADVGRMMVEIAAVAVRDLQIVSRRCLRELMVASCEEAGFTMLHASAITDGQRVVIFAADKRGGKTTLAVRAVLEHGWNYLSNDHLIVYPDQADLILTSLPTLIPVKVGTLLDIWHMLPAPPFDSNGIDLAVWSSKPREERYAADVGVYYTYRRLGQDNPVTVRLDEGADRSGLVVVFPSYASFSAGAHHPEAMSDWWQELVGHVRLDWMFGQGSAERYLPWPHRDQGRFAADGRELCWRLGQHARFMRWRHRGEVAPLLDILSQGDCP